MAKRSKRRRYARRRSRKYKRKRFRRRKYRLPPNISSRGIIPSRIRRRHLYAESLSINPTGSTVSEHVFTPTNLYDPNYTGTGHQPYGYDQMGLFFKNYLVTGVDFKITMMHDSNGGTEAGFWGFVRWDTSDSPDPTPANWASAREMIKCYPKLAPPTAQRPLRLRFNNQNIMKLMGAKNADFRDQFVGVIPSTAPSRNLRLSVGLANLTATDNATITVNVEMTMTVLWWSPLQTVTS